MTDTPQAATSKLPTHIAYHVKKGKDKGFFTRIGAAWPTKQGNLSIQLDVVPLDGRIILCLASEKQD